MPFTYEAELATLSGPEVATNHEGYLGSGFADYLNPTGDYTEFVIAVDADGQYDLSFRYALGAAANRSLSLTIDGEVITTLDFNSTGDWTNWNDVAEQVQLTAGTHAVRLTAIGTSGPNLDALTVETLSIEVPPIVTPPEGGGETGGDPDNDGVTGGGGEPGGNPGDDGLTGANNAFFSFEQWVAYTAIKTGVVYQSSLVDFNIQVGGLRVAPLFDEAAYLQANPDVAAAVQQGTLRYGFEHFVRFGMDEGRTPGDWFDQDYYLAQNSDVATAIENGTVRSAIAHFFAFGHRESRNPNAFFDADDYLLNNSDVKDAIAAGRIDSAFEHYAEFGIEEGRQSGFLFDEAFYLEKNPDVAAAVQAGTFALGMYHFFSIGQSEGRDPSSLFDQSAYLERYGDVAAAVAGGAFASGFEHYLLHGYAEGRIAV
jgi:hypothetical protein